MSNKEKEWQPSKPCTICRNWLGEILSLHEGVAVIRCRGCGLYYVDSLPLTKQEADEEGRIALENGPTYFREVYEEKINKWTRYYLDWLRRIENWTSDRKLLDIGCGVGQLVRVACDSGWDAYGIDNSFDTIAHGKRALNLGNRLIAGTLSEASLSDDFNVVTLFSVIEHVDDPFDLLIQVKRILHPRGVILVKTPSQDSLVTKLHWALFKVTGGKTDLELYNRDHIYRFSKHTLHRLLTETGFELEGYYLDDHLWITATRYLLHRNLKSLRFLAMSVVIMVGKVLRMDNQIVMIARPKSFNSD